MTLEDRAVRKRSQIHRTQVLVLSFFALAWIGLGVILLVAPATYDQSLKLQSGGKQLAEIAFFLAITVFLAVLGIGVLRRWRWMFWLVLVAFLAGVLRVPAAVLDVTGLYPMGDPAWYVVFQGIIGVVQFAIGTVMLTSYRRGGVWG